jgi:hypothetical protein
MVDPKTRLRLRARRLEHQLRKQTDRALVPVRRLRARALRLRQRAATTAVQGLALAGGLVEALAILRDQRRRFARRASKSAEQPAVERAVGRSVIEPEADAAAAEPEPETPHADERTIRRMAEREHGGISTDEMLARYEAGLNPGGLHGRAMRDRLGTDDVRHVEDEPDDPKARRPGHARHMPAHRRGS